VQGKPLYVNGSGNGMKSLVAAALLTAALLIALPGAVAQSNGQGISVTNLTLAEPVPYMGKATANVTVNVGCIDAARDNTVEITAPGAPAWVKVTSAPTNAAPTQDCVNASGSRSVFVPVQLEVTADAPGVVPTALNLTAAISDKTATGTLTFNVEYYPEFEMSTDVEFPLSVTGGQVSFNLTVTQKSNARSMVMMENVSVSAGSLSGLASVVYEADNLTKTFPITYKAPTGAWTNATANFTAFTHYLLLEGGAGDFTAPQSVSWTFVNAGGSSNPDGPSGEKKESPAGALPLLVMGLFALALIVRRR
jgi:hypothetical protein